MAKRIFIQDNYLVIDRDNGSHLLYIEKKATLTYEGSHFQINGRAQYFSIPTAEASTWFAEDGTTAYSEATLLSFLTVNTSFSLAGSAAPPTTIGGGALYQYSHGAGNASSGKVTFNNSDLSAATTMNISYLTDNDSDLSSWMKFNISSSEDVGAKIYIQEKDDATKYATFEISSVSIDDANSQLTLGVTNHSGASSISNNSHVVIVKKRNSSGEESGVTTAYAWNPLAGSSLNGTSGTYLNLSQVPNDFLIDGSSWAFAVRLGSSVHRGSNVATIFSSNQASSGVGVQTGGSVSGYTNQDLELVGMSNTDYNGNYDISTKEGRWANNNGANTESSYRIYKKPATGGFHIVVNDMNTGYWIAGFTATDPDSWVDGNSYTVTGSENITNFAGSDGATGIPWGSDDNVSYTGGDVKYTNYWAKLVSSGDLLGMENDVVLYPDSWLLFSFDSASGQFSAWVGDTKTNNGTSVSFGSTALSSVVFGQEAAGYSSAYFYQFPCQVTDIMIITGDTITDANAAEFTSSTSGLSSLSAGLQAKIDHAWSFSANGPVTNKGLIDLSAYSSEGNEVAYTEVIIPSA